MHTTLGVPCPGTASTRFRKRCSKDRLAGGCGLTRLDESVEVPGGVPRSPSGDSDDLGGAAAQKLARNGRTKDTRPPPRIWTAMTRATQPELSLRITVVDPLPGVWLRLQSGRADLVEASARTSAEVSFDFSVRIGSPQPDGRPTFLGPFAQGPPASRFVYINAGASAGQPGTPWNRRAKIPLGGICQEQVSAVLRKPGAMLEVRYPGRGRDGGPTCATVRLPPSAWVIRNKAAV